MRGYVGAIDQGTTSTRFLIFDRKGASSAQRKRSTSRFTRSRAGLSTTRRRSGATPSRPWPMRLPRPGFPPQILSASASPTSARRRCFGTATPESRSATRLSGRTRAPTGIVSELCKDGGQDRLRGKTGLPLATYFSGLKLRWLLENIPGARAKAASGDALFGTIDSWLVWNMTGGPRGGLHITDVTNASRTQMMNLATLDWDWDLLSLFDVPRACLPKIRPSSQIYGEATKSAPRRSHRRHPWRPARGSVRASLPQTGRGKKHLRNRLLHAHEYGRAHVSVHLRAVDHARLSA